MTDKSEKQIQQEITFVVESSRQKDDDSLVAIRKGDRAPDEDGRVPGGWTSGYGKTPLEAIENCVRSLRANNER